MKFFNLVLILGLSLSVLSACSSKSEKEGGDGEFNTKVTDSVVTKEVEYRAGGKTMKGFLAMPAEGEGPFPGVLVVHEWWGQTDYPRERARKLAEAGYAAFAVDMYGDGYTADHPDDAKKFASKVMKDMDTAEESFRTALSTFKAQGQVDQNNIAAMGYCFGGAVVLEMARRGVDMRMVASYHGDLTPLVKNEVPKMKTRMLIFNGAADTFVPKEAVRMARAKLKAAGVRYKLVNYKGAKHGFTNPAADENGKKFGIDLAYDKRADEKSWDETLKAFNIVFK